MMAGTLQHDGYSSHVITPVISWRDAILQIDLDRFGEIRGMQQELAVTAGSNSDPDVEFDRGRHHETVVVVGVLANEVDATRSSVHARATTVTLAESLLQLGCYLHTLIEIRRSCYIRPPNNIKVCLETECSAIDHKI